MERLSQHPAQVPVVTGSQPHCPAQDLSTLAHLALHPRDRPEEEQDGPPTPLLPVPRGTGISHHVVLLPLHSSPEMNGASRIGLPTTVCPTPTLCWDRTSADFAINWACLAMLVSPFTEMLGKRIEPKTKQSSHQLNVLQRE